MDTTYLARTEIRIEAAPARVWDALTKPDLIKQYFFGTQVTTDWKAGSPITYRGEWQGEAYEDKGRILQVESGKLLVSTYWSSLSGLADLPENYNTVRYELSPQGTGTRLVVIQDNNKTEEDARHNEGNWKMVLEGIKRLLEN